MERYVVLGLARARTAWFQAVGQWATAALLPAEFVRCVSVEELRTRLRSGRRFSAAVVDGTLPGLDRDVIGLASEASVAVIVVDDAHRRDWRELGAAAVLAADFSRGELLDVLAATTAPVREAVLTLGDAPSVPDVADAAPGYVVAVTGPGGTGASSVAAALAQGLGTAGGGGAAVLLADLCRHADQAMLHDARVLVPGVQELVDGFRSADPVSDVVVEHTFDVPERGYRLLLGLRRPRHWVSLPQRSLERALTALAGAFDVVVADVEPDLEGTAETGSPDIEDRNRMARATIERAGIVVVVGEPSMKGIFALARLVEELHGFGVVPDRILPVVNAAPRRPRSRTGLTRALHEVLEASVGPVADRVPTPLQLPERPVDAAFRDGVALPAAMAGPLARSVQAMHARVGDRVSVVPSTAVPVVPGSLSGWSGSEAET